MKKFNLFLIVAISALLFTACDKNVKLDTLAGTSWRYDFNKNEYQTYDFYEDGSCNYFIHSASGDVTLPLEWTCTASGYVKTTVKITEKTWKTGTFDKDKGTLVMDGLKYTLTKH
jgi:hypothetical protein